MLFIFVVLQVSVSYDIVIPDTEFFDIFASKFFWGIFGWSIFRSSKMVSPQICITHDVVVYVSVLTRSEIPWLIFGVILTTLKALHFVLEVKDIVGLLVSQSSILVRSQDISHSLILKSFLGMFSSRFIVFLSDWVVDNILRLDECMVHFLVNGCFTLEVLLCFLIAIDFLVPLRVSTSWQADCFSQFFGVCTFHLHCL